MQTLLSCLMYIFLARMQNTFKFTNRNLILEISFIQKIPLKKIKLLNP